MELTSINEHVRSEERDSLILQSYDARGRELVLAFTCDGGRREDEALVVRFHDAAHFHHPSVLYSPVLFRIAEPEEAQRLVPPASYDADELSGKSGGLSVVVLENREGSPYGYYIAAERVEATGKSRSECLWVWWTFASRLSTSCESRP
jgi:hypothetical protein